MCVVGVVLCCVVDDNAVDVDGGVGVGIGRVVVSVDVVVVVIVINVVVIAIVVEFVGGVADVVVRGVDVRVVVSYWYVGVFVVDGVDGVAIVVFVVVVIWLYS